MELFKNTEWDFRHAVQADAEKVLSLYRRAQSEVFCVWNDYYPSMTEIRHDLGTDNLYVLTYRDEIVGAISVVPENELDAFACWSSKKGTAREIARVVIAREHQGSGLAYAMLQQIIPILQETGCRAVHLSVVKTHIPAYKTYLKAGFTIAGEAEIYGDSYYLMEKEF